MTTRGVGGAGGAQRQSRKVFRRFVMPGEPEGHDEKSVSAISGRQDHTCTLGPKVDCRKMLCEFQHAWCEPSHL
jgi:hypothetical protein